MWLRVQTLRWGDYLKLSMWVHRTTYVHQSGKGKQKIWSERCNMFDPPCKLWRWREGTRTSKSWQEPSADSKKWKPYSHNHNEFNHAKKLNEIGPSSLQKGIELGDILVLVWWDLYQTVHLHNCEIINLRYFKPLHW